MNEMSRFDQTRELYRADEEKARKHNEDRPIKCDWWFREDRSSTMNEKDSND